MASARQLLVIAWRESRTARRRLLLYMSSISLGVAALVAIDSFADNVTRSVHEQSRALLGGDVSLNTGDPWTKPALSFLDSLRHAGIGVAQSTNFPSMGFVPRSGGTRLVQVRAVSPGFPWYGQIVSAPTDAWPRLHSGRYAVVDPAVLVSLNARLGDTLRLGSANFLITGTLASVPGEVGVTAAIGPRIYISDRYLAETGLLVFGSRASYEAVLELPASFTAQRFVARFRGELTAIHVRMRTAQQTENNLNRAIDQLRDFLSIIGLVALLLGGIGVASGIHAFVMRKIDTVAVLRCVGATSRQVLLIYGTQAVAMGLIGAVAGALLGVGIQFAFPSVLADFLPVDVKVRIAPLSLGIGVVVGVWVALIFAMQPLVGLRRVSPLQALRRESDAHALRRGQIDPLREGISVAIAGSVFLFALFRAGNVQRGIGFTVAIAAALGTLWASAALLSTLARRAVRPVWPFVVRQGIANLYRPGNQTRAVVLALGFGVFLMSTIYQLQQNLLRSLDVRLQEARANLVFFDVQEDQASGLDSVIRASRAEIIEEAPIVITRIAAINGRPISQLFADTLRGRRSPWVLRREYRSTFRDSLTGAERVVAGQWQSERPNDAAGDSMPWISVDRDVAREMRVAPGDTVTWNVQGVEIPTRVTSLREVNWASFQPNFFVVFSPRALQRAPKQYVILVRAAGNDAIAHLQRDVVSRYGNVSSLDLSLVQHTITNVLSKVTMAIRFMALICLALGIPVLFSAVAATRRERLREGVLLKTLGATKRQIGQIMLAEYVLLGGLGSLTGALLSVLGAWALMHWIFRMSFNPFVVPAILVGLAMMMIAVAIGLLTGREVFAETPMVALREA